MLPTRDHQPGRGRVIDPELTVAVRTPGSDRFREILDEELEAAMERAKERFVDESDIEV